MIRWWIPLLLVACSPARIVTKLPEPPRLECPAECWTPCTVDGIQYTGQPGEPGAWDRLVTDVVIPLRGRIDECELSRLACARCLDGLKRAGVVR